MYTAHFACVQDIYFSVINVSVSYIARIPSQDLFSKLVKEIGQEGFSEYVRDLVFGDDHVYRDHFVPNVLPEMMVFHIDMLGAWENLGDFRYFECSCVIFKHVTVYFGLDNFKWVNLIVYFL